MTKLPVSVEHLKLGTGGKTVKKLQKGDIYGPEIKVLAQALYASWSKLVEGE